MDNLGTTLHTLGTTWGEPAPGHTVGRAASRRVSDPPPTLEAMTVPRRLRVVAAPLPECLLCEAPTRRDVHARLGGLCSGCDIGVRRAAALLPPLEPKD